MEAGAYAGRRYLVCIGAKTGEMVRNTGCGGARQCDFWDLVSAEFRSNDCGEGRIDDAMSTGIFGVHWSCIYRLPRRIALGGRIAIAISIAYCRDWSPEFVGILDLKKRDSGIGFCHRTPGQLVFRLVGAPDVNIEVLGTRLPTQVLDRTDDFNDHWVLQLGAVPLPFDKTRDDFRAGFPCEWFIAVVGLDYPFFEIVFQNDLLRWTHAVRYSQLPGSICFKENLPVPPPSAKAAESCLYYRSPLRRAARFAATLRNSSGQRLNAGDSHPWHHHSEIYGIIRYCAPQGLVLA
jgi:hypothetical protein